MLQKIKTNKTILSIDINLKKLNKMPSMLSLNQYYTLKKRTEILAKQALPRITEKQDNRNKTISFSLRKTTLKTKIKNIFFKDNNNFFIDSKIPKKFEEKVSNGQQKPINFFVTKTLLNQIHNWRKRLVIGSKSQSNNFFFSLKKQSPYFESDFNISVYVSAVGTYKQLTNLKQTNFLSSGTLLKKNAKVYRSLEKLTLSKSIEHSVPLQSTQYHYNLWRKGHTNLMISKQKTVQQPFVKKQNLGFIFYWLIPFVGFVFSSGPLYRTVLPSSEFSSSQNFHLNNSNCHPLILQEKGIQSLKTNSYFIEPNAKHSSRLALGSKLTLLNNTKSLFFFKDLNSIHPCVSGSKTLLKFFDNLTPNLTFLNPHSLQLITLGFFDSLVLDKLRPYYIQPIFNCFTNKIKNKKDNLFFIKHYQIVNEPLKLVEQPKIKSKTQKKLKNMLKSILPYEKNTLISHKNFETHKSQKLLNHLPTQFVLIPGLSVYNTTAFLLENGIKSSFVTKTLSFSNIAKKSSFTVNGSKITSLFSQKAEEQLSTEVNKTNIYGKLPLNNLFNVLQANLYMRLQTHFFSLDTFSNIYATEDPIFRTSNLYKPAKTNSLLNLNSTKSVIGENYTSNALGIPYHYKKCLKMSHPIIYLTGYTSPAAYSFNQPFKEHIKLEKDLSSFTAYKPDFSTLFYSSPPNVYGKSQFINKTTFNNNTNQASLKELTAQRRNFNSMSDPELNTKSFVHTYNSPQGLNFHFKNNPIKMDKKTTVNSFYSFNSLFTTNSFKMVSPHNWGENKFSRFFSNYIHFLLTSINIAPSTMNRLSPKQIVYISSVDPTFTSTGDFTNTEGKKTQPFKRLEFFNNNLRFEKIFRASLSNGISTQFLFKKENKKPSFTFLNKNFISGYKKQARPKVLTLEKAFANTKKLSHVRLYQYTNKSKFKSSTEKHSFKFYSQKTFFNTKFKINAKKQNKKFLQKGETLKLVPRILLKTQKFYKYYFVSQGSRNNYLNYKTVDNLVETKDNNGLTERFAFKQKKQKKRRIRKIRKQTLSRKKRKRFYPRPMWLRYRILLNFSALINSNSHRINKVTTKNLPENVETFNFTTSNAIKKYLLKNYFPTQSTTFRSGHIAKESKNTNGSETGLTLSPQELKARAPSMHFVHKAPLSLNLTHAIVEKSALKVTNTIDSDSEKFEINEKLLKDNRAFKFIINNNVNNYFKRIKNYLNQIRSSTKNVGLKKFNKWPTNFKNAKIRQKYLNAREEYNRIIYTRIQKIIQMSLINTQKLTEPEKKTVRFNELQVKGKNIYSKDDYQNINGVHPKDVTLNQNEKSIEVPTNALRNQLFIKKAYKPGYKKISLILSDYAKPSSKDPQDTSPLKRNKDFKQKTFLQETWMWLFNIGYGNLCWGSSFGLNNFELPNSVNPIYLSWALNKTNNWFFGTLATKAKIDYKINPQNKNLWALQRLRYQGKSNKTKYLQMRTQIFLDSFINGQQKIKISKNYLKNDVRSLEKQNKVKNSKMFFKLFNDSKKQKLNKLHVKVLQNWKRKEQKLRYLGFDFQGPIGLDKKVVSPLKGVYKIKKDEMSKVYTLTALDMNLIDKKVTNMFNKTKQQKTFIKNSNPPNAKNLWFLTKTRTMPFNHHRCLSKLSHLEVVDIYNDPISQKIKSKIQRKDLNSVQAYSNKLNINNRAISLHSVQTHTHVTKPIFYSLVFHFCALISLVSISQIRCFFKFNFLILFKLMTNSKNLINSILAVVIKVFNKKMITTLKPLGPSKISQIKTTRQIHFKNSKRSLTLNNSKKMFTTSLFSNSNGSLLNNKNQNLKFTHRTLKLLFRNNKLNTIWSTDMKSSLKFSNYSKVSYAYQSTLILKTILLNMVERIMVRSLSIFQLKLLSNTVFLNSFLSLFTKNLKDFLKMIMAFSKNPEIFINDFVANAFLVEWSSDLIILIPENLEFMAWNSFKMFSQTIKTSFLFSSLSFFISNTLLILTMFSKKFKHYHINFALEIIMTGFLQKILYSMIYSFIQILSQPDSDLIGRQKKGTLFWENWAEILTKAADKYNIVIPSLAILKEEQLMLTSLITNSKTSFSNNKPIVNINESYNLHKGLNKIKNIVYTNNIPTHYLSVPAQINPLDISSEWAELFKLKQLNKLTLTYLDGPLKFTHRSNAFASILLDPLMGVHKLFTGLDSSKVYTLNDYGGLSTKETLFLENPTYKKQGPLASSVNQFVTTLSKDTDLFLDYHLAKSFSHISSIRYYHQVQNALGFITCSIFSGLFSKQQAKNILIIGKDNSQMLKSLLITALAGETELKMITDNAHRYALIVGGVAVGIRLLRDVFDALALHAPCLFLLENIHAIGERRPFLFADSSQDLTKQSEEIISSGSPEMQLQMEEQNKIQAESSYHAIKHYKKPYKGEFSLGIPSNHFSFNLLKNKSQIYTTRSLTKKNPIRYKIISLKEDNNRNELLGVKNVFFGLMANTNKFLLKIMDKNKIQNINMFGLMIEDTKQTLISRIQYKSQQIKEQKIAPPATSPLNVLVIKEQKKFKPEKVVQQLGFQGLSNEKLVHLPRYSYSIRTKVALLAENALSNMSAKLDMITDLLMIFDSVRTHRGFVVFATTHIPSILDPALRRPGRLDETIRIPKVQNIWSRWQMFKTTISFTVGERNSNLKFITPCFPHNSFWSTAILTNSLSNKKREFLNSLMYQNKFNISDKSLEKSLKFNHNYSQQNRFNIYGFLQKNKNMFKENASRLQLLAPSRGSFYREPPIFYRNGFYSSNSYKQYLCTLNLIDYRFTGLFNLRSDAFTKEVSTLLTCFGTGIRRSRALAPGVLGINDLKFIRKDWLQTNSSFEISLLKIYKKIKAITYYTIGKNLINTSMCYNLGLYGNTVNALQENSLDQYVAFYSNKTLFKILLTQMLGGKMTEKFVFASIPYKIESARTLQKNTKQEKIGIFKGLLETTLYGLKETCQTSISLLFSLLQKKYTFNKNLIIPSLLDLGDTSINNRYLPESPPNNLILIPSKRYENYKRARLLYDKKVEVAIGEKIQLHQQKQFILNLYNQQKAPINNYLNLNSIPINELSFSSKYYRQHIINRHRQYLTNQWWSLQLPEQNAETLFLSDLDWRYTFIPLIGDFLIDYPDVEQFYNPNQKRGLDFITWNTESSGWRRGKELSSSLKFQSALVGRNFTRDIFEHYIYESFIKTFDWLDKNRELLDYSAYLYQKKGFIKENQIINNFKRFTSL